MSEQKLSRASHSSRSEHAMIRRLNTTKLDRLGQRLVSDSSSPTKPSNIEKASRDSGIKIKPDFDKLREDQESTHLLKSNSVINHPECKPQLQDDSISSNDDELIVDPFIIDIALG